MFRHNPGASRRGNERSHVLSCLKNCATSGVARVAGAFCNVRQTGIETDTDLIEFALATVALEDTFAETFRRSRGKADAELKLGF
jgi:hypothetical protein